jgi:hypothetical protein
MTLLLVTWNFPQRNLWSLDFRSDLLYTLSLWATYFVLQWWPRGSSVFPDPGKLGSQTAIQVYLLLSIVFVLGSPPIVDTPLCHPCSLSIAGLSVLPKDLVPDPQRDIILKSRGSSNHFTRKGVLSPAALWSHISNRHLDCLILLKVKDDRVIMSPFWELAKMAAPPP